MNLFSILAFTIILHLVNCVDLCTYPVGAQAHCDVSANHFCCNNIAEGVCCGFDNSDGSNTGLGGSVSIEGLPDGDQSNVYQAGSPACTSFIGGVITSGCLAFTGGNRAASSNWFPRQSRRRSNDMGSRSASVDKCQAPNLAVYADEDGVMRSIQILDGHYDIVMGGVTDRNFSLLNTYTTLSRGSTTG